MKNKKIFRTLAALCTCLMLMGGFSVTAFAQGTDSRALRPLRRTPPMTAMWWWRKPRTARR